MGAGSVLRFLKRKRVVDKIACGMMLALIGLVMIEPQIRIAKAFGVVQPTVCFGDPSHARRGDIIGWTFQVQNIWEGDYEVSGSFSVQPPFDPLVVTWDPPLPTIQPAGQRKNYFVNVTIPLDAPSGKYETTLVVNGRPVGGNVINSVTFSSPNNMRSIRLFEIQVASPQAATYPSETVPLTFIVSDYEPSWMGYSLDGQTNVTVTGNTTLTGLSQAQHTLIVYANDTSGRMGRSDIVTFTVHTPLWYTLAVNSSPIDVAFTANGENHVPPWSGTYVEGTIIDLVMPETYSVGDAKYQWNAWSDGVASCSRRVTLNSNLSLTADFTGPCYELAVDSSPAAGIPFTMNGVSNMTPYTEWLPEGYYTLEMPQTYVGYYGYYNWSHWLEDGSSNRIKSVYVDHGISCTAIYTAMVVPGPVHNINTGLNYMTIRGAIDAPETLDGHTILVDSGVYRESTLQITKPLTIKGGDCHNTIIVGGIVVDGVDGINISGLTIGELPSQNGINDVTFGAGADNCTLSDCILLNAGMGQIDNDIPGVVVVGSGWTISGNLILGPGIPMAGLLLIGSNNNVVGNTLGNETFPAYRIQLDNANVYVHNNFYIDKSSCWVSPSSIWDDGYPSGGNYWSFYDGLDSYQGPNQDGPGGDGIGDTPLLFGGQVYDRYPLMEPWTPTQTSIRAAGKDYPVTIVTNTTLEKIVTTPNTLHFKSSGPTGDKGYISVIFPMVNTTDIKVFVDGKKLTPPSFPVINSNGTHYFIYFEFTLSSHDIGIQFAPSAPEVPVGGEWVPIDKLQLLPLWTSLASTIAVAASLVGIKRIKKRQD